MADRIEADLRQLWTRVVFNILVANTDDHLRNHGFIYAGAGWRLAPAYDVNINPNRAQHAPAIDERDHARDVQRAVATAGHNGLHAAQAQEILERVQRAIGGWREKARALRLNRSETSLVESVLGSPHG